MRRRLIIYESGRRIVTQGGIDIDFGEPIEAELDLSDLPEKEWEKVKKNPHIHKYDKPHKM